MENYLKLYVLPVIIGFFIDLVIGDPPGYPHPVRIIGKAIEIGESGLRSRFSSNATMQYISGMILSLAVVAISFLIPALIVYWLGGVNEWMRVAFSSLICYQVLAAKSLKAESMKVYHQLEKGDLEGSRKALSYIVGRDTAELNEEQVAKAAIETVAENCSDGVIAPMLYLFLGGAPLGMCYKAINTLDSMIGYKNEKYMYFGRFAAKLDDVANYVPSRISAVLLLLSGALPGMNMDLKNGIVIFRRDRYNHKSPNSAQTEAVCAGLLDVCLAGDSYYGGVLVTKPTIGDPIRNVAPNDIKRANKVMYGAAFIGLGIFSACSIFIKLVVL